MFFAQKFKKINNRNDSILFNENTFIKKLQAELDAAHKRHEDLQKVICELK